MNAEFYRSMLMTLTPRALLEIARDFLVTAGEISDYFPDKRLVKRDGKALFWRYYLQHADRNDFGFFLHQLVDSDQPYELHSHPWTWAFSVILSGSYEEERGQGLLRADDAQDVSEPVRYSFTGFAKKVFRPFDVNLFQVGDYHRLNLVDGPVWTLFVHGPRAQYWSFIHRETGAKRDVHTRTYDGQEVRL